MDGSTLAEGNHLSTRGRVALHLVIVVSTRSIRMMEGPDSAAWHGGWLVFPSYFKSCFVPWRVISFDSA